LTPAAARATGRAEACASNLANEGRSNKEVEARLFITVRTVEASLSKVYAKPGIRSRTELASRLAARS
jgi:DNA-binding NarL/FixJ family response regulator